MTRPDPTQAERQARRRQRIRETGCVVVRVVAHIDDRPAIEAFAQELADARVKAEAVSLT